MLCCRNHATARNWIDAESDGSKDIFLCFVFLLLAIVALPPRAFSHARLCEE